MSKNTPIAGNFDHCKWEDVCKTARAKYGTERAPMLSSHEFDAMCAKAIEDGDNEVERVFNSAASVLEFFESLITKGVLRVAKKATYGDAPGLAANCSECPHLSTLGESKYFKFCPGCGAEIVKP